MPEQAETRIIQAAFALVSSDAGMIAQFPNGFRLLEQRSSPDAFGAGIMAIGGFSIAPKDYPSMVEEIFVEVQFCPILVAEPTTQDSELLAMKLFNQLRKVLFTAMRDSSGALTDADGTAAEAVVDYSWPRMLTNLPGIRIPIFRAIFRQHINLATGEPE